MNKKILVVAAVLMIACAAGAFAFGIGIQGGGGYPAPGNAGVTFKLDSLPLVFAANASFGDSFRIGATADYWVLNDTITGPLNWFIGGGVGAGFSVGSDFAVLLTARVPVGLNMFLVDGFIEPYVQVVPALGLNFGSGSLFNFVFDANLGVRFWF
ncbi:hypothetical protein [Treponema brennaborense]|uniref:Lipoprotein n=1 Tax=Treponema brennaborense (strain DSM 12168 / CIP 105900 / DD5/3) TaxID=906968 RepID=F4LJX9_TREBD|nr:hypothetical protein [Treponema brennaborense]AEE16459.1 hypothetical protein Trebr_1025 [Treponema brennaborense DSM 12168]